MAILSNIVIKDKDGNNTGEVRSFTDNDVSKINQALDDITAIALVTNNNIQNISTLETKVSKIESVKIPVSLSIVNGNLVVTYETISEAE